MILHVTPINDIKPHEELSTCQCEPTVIVENGSMIMVHNSFDGRERNEEIPRPVIEFKPLFYLLDKNPNQLSSIAVEIQMEHGYEGVSFKEWNTGWSVNPVRIGKGFITDANYFDFTNNFDEAIKHASIK